MLKNILLIAALIAVGNAAHSQTNTNRSILAKTAQVHKQKETENLKKALALAKEKGWSTVMKIDDANIALLTGVDQFGLPIYTSTQNTVAAATIGTSKLWEGGSSGLNLNGSSSSVRGKMAVWDGGSVSATHAELIGRILQRDVVSVSDHATHVAGTMIASGVNPLARGMAYGYQQLLSYDFSNHISEISGEAANLLLSNHSYGAISGWHWNSSQSRWEFYGRSTDNEDYKFGYYSSDAQMLDSIAYNSPYYLIVKSAGNNRDQNGPAAGQTYWRLNAQGQLINAGPRPSGISDNNAYDVISTYGTSKNILTVGAVNGLALGYTTSSDVLIGKFSSWGPTDDGRIKPDVVADGVNLLSSVSQGDNTYAAFSGTSMATPATTGSLLLLQEYYAQVNSGTFMRSSTLRGLAIHTTEETGDAPGPDYRFGWGLLNVARAAEVIKAKNAGPHRIMENILASGQTYSMTVTASGQGPLVATIAWIDPKGNVENVDVLNNTTRRLVHDLDIRISTGATTFMPWILDPSNPSVSASKGDNIRDNVERIDIDNPIPGASYTIVISHKGSLERGSQAYSLILSGVGGQAYCSSAASSNAGTRIDNVVFSNVNKSSPAGCTTYNNFADAIANVQPSQTLPITVKLSSCDASNAPKIVKVFIDYNNNGSFGDAGELVATSGVINGSGTYTGTVQISSHVSIGNSTRIRIVAQETSTAADVNSCGAYANGETQDYTLKFVAPSNDLSLIDIASPESASCGNQTGYVSIKIRNNGVNPKQDLPVKLTVKEGSTTIVTANTVFNGSVDISSVMEYTFQTPIFFKAGSTYHIEAVVSESSDQLKLNDTLRKQIVIAAQPPAPNATGEICGTTAMLRVNNPGNNTYFWYNAAPVTTPFAKGSNITTSNIPGNRTFYVTSGASASIGPKTKMVYPEGGYNVFNGNSIRVTADVPVILETARLYIGNKGRIKFVVNPMASETSYYPSLGDSVTLDVTRTALTTPPLGTQLNDPSDTGAIYRLNLKLDNSVSSNYVLWIRIEDGASIFRNNNITTNPYPVGVPGLFTITRNSATDASDQNYYQKFYYFFYDMKVRTMSECVSGTATVVAPVAPTPAITKVNDSLVSSIDAGNQWYLNGVAISGATDKKFKPTENGNYTVVVTDNFGCQQTSAPLSVVVTAINPVDNAQVNLRLAPNPNNGSFTLSFNMVRRNDLRIDLVNSAGQSVLVKQYPNFQGSFSEQINLQNTAAGVYMLKIQHGTKTFYNKVLIQR